MRFQKTACRRTIFADLYNVEWDSNFCNQKCDICASKTGRVEVEVTTLWKDMYAILKVVFYREFELFIKL